MNRCVLYRTLVRACARLRSYQLAALSGAFATFGAALATFLADETAAEGSQTSLKTTVATLFLVLGRVMIISHWGLLRRVLSMASSIGRLWVHRTTRRTVTLGRRTVTLGRRTLMIVLLCRHYTLLFKLR